MLYRLYFRCHAVDLSYDDDVAAWQQATFKDETTDADDWYGEQTEDKAHYSVVREARPYDRGRQRGKVEAASVSDSTSDVRRQHAVDHVYSEPFRPQM